MKGQNEEKDFRSVSGFNQAHCLVLLRPGSALFYFPINNVLNYGSIRHYTSENECSLLLSLPGDGFLLEGSQKLLRKHSN